MTKRTEFRKETSEAILASARMLHEVGAFDKTTMRDFDARHLVVPGEMGPNEIKLLREANKVSQPLFARYLSVRPERC